jgi:hypothetical protein
MAARKTPGINLWSEKMLHMARSFFATRAPTAGSRWRPRVFCSGRRDAHNTKLRPKAGTASGAYPRKRSRRLLGNAQLKICAARKQRRAPDNGIAAVSATSQILPTLAHRACCPRDDTTPTMANVTSCNYLQMNAHPRHPSFPRGACQRNSDEYLGGGNRRTKEAEASP